MRRVFAGLCLAIASLFVEAESPPANIRELLQPYTYPISLKGNQLSGPGAKLIFDVAEVSQFVAVGEEHNDLSLPPIAASLFRTLHEKSGFNYLAEEQDPAMMRAVSSAPVRGNLLRIQALAQQYKLGFTFISDQELKLIADVGAISTGRGRPIWGCEQAFGVTHVLDQVADKAPSPAARQLIARLRAESSAGEANRDLQRGHFIAKPELTADLQALSKAYAGSGPEMRFLTKAIAASNQIYVLHENGDGSRGPGRFAANSMREEYMKSVCRAEYLNARARDHRDPKVILKFGHNHLFEQWGPNGFSTLGNFFANIARWNGTRYTSIASFYSTINGKPAWEVGSLAFLRPFKDVIPPDKWVVIDLRALREGDARNALVTSVKDLTTDQQQQLSALISGFDFLLLLGPKQKATFSVAQVKN